MTLKLNLTVVVHADGMVAETWIKSPNRPKHVIQTWEFHWPATHSSLAVNLAEWTLAGIDREGLPCPEWQWDENSEGFVWVWGEVEMKRAA